MYIHMYIHVMKRKSLKRKSAKRYPRRSENKREFLKASNETEKPQKKSTCGFRQRDYRPGRGGKPILFYILILHSHSPIPNHYWKKSTRTTKTKTSKQNKKKPKSISFEVFLFHLRLSEALVCFRSSGDNFVRSFF